MPCGREAGAGGFSLLEMLVVVTIISIMVGLTVGVTGALQGSRGSTAVQQLAAVIETARARALTGRGEVMVAFATHAAADSRLAYRALVICQRDAFTEEQQPKFMPVSEWFLLPEGYVFTLAQPAESNAGMNVFTVADAMQKVVLPGNGLEVELPCIGFGDLGQVTWPVETNGRPVLLAIAEGGASVGSPVDARGMGHVAADCRWLAVQKNSGNTMILP